MRVQLGRLTTAFFSSGIKCLNPLALISMEILTDVMKGWFPAELMLLYRHLLLFNLKGERILRGCFISFLRKKNVKTGSAVLKASSTVK